MAGPLGFKQPGSPNPVYHYTLGDGQGSVMGLTDDSGTITDQYQYDSFGSNLSLQNPPPNNTYNPYRYTGQQSDSATNLYYLRNRYYDAQTGRFITKDPIGFNGGLNFYCYVQNNPVNFWDPLGLDASVIYNPSGNSGKGCIGVAINDPDDPYGEKIIYYNFQWPGIINTSTFDNMDALQQKLGITNDNVATISTSKSIGGYYYKKGVVENAIKNWVEGEDKREPNYNDISYNSANFVKYALGAGGIKLETKGSVLDLISIRWWIDPIISSFIPLKPEAVFQAAKEYAGFQR